jgi:hypothetical protein
MATELPPNVCKAVAATPTLTELRLFAPWLIIWSAEGKSVYLVTGDAEEGGSIPVASRLIPANALPFPIDVSPYDGQVFIAASEACTVILEGRE